jgi:mttA/Hcf106 family
MFGLSFWHIAILVVIAFLLFGGKLSDLMGAAGRHLRARDGLAPMLGNQFLPPALQRILKLFFK